METNVSLVKLLQNALDGVRQLQNNPPEEIPRWITEVSTIPANIPLPDGNGNVALITVDGYRAIVKFADNIWQNNSTLKQTVDANSFLQVTLDCLGEMLPELLEVDNITKESLKNLRNRIFSKLKEKQLPVIHYFPCWLFRDLQVTKFNIGCVEFMQLNDWLLKVEQVSINHQDWIIEVQEYWKGRRSIDSLEDKLSKIIVSAVDGCFWIAAVHIENHEWKKSYERSRFAVRLALDALGLTMEPSQVKNIQLKAEANPPSAIKKLSQFDGYELGYPGVEHNPPGIYESANQWLETNSNFLKAAGRLIETIVSLESDRNTQKLDERWLNALYWYGEACREPTDFIALVKLGVSLDILTKGEKRGICEFTCKLFGKKDSDPITRDGTTLKQIVEDLYSEGRSQIGHGSKLGILEDYSFSRQRSSFFVRDVLREAIVRLSTYQGEDDLKAFINSL
jgi:hypothetical protein